MLSTHIKDITSLQKKISTLVGLKLVITQELPGSIAVTYTCI